jgi:hypothetical protein
MQYSFTYHAKSDANKKLQDRLIQLGFLAPTDMSGLPNNDGIFGQGTAKALGAFLGATGPVTVVTQDTFNRLWPNEAPSLGSPIMQNILGGILSGLFGNLLTWTMVSGWIRSGLVAWGTTWVTTGVITGNQLNDAVGAIIILGGIIWQLIQNNINHNAMQVVKAVAAHPDISVVPANNSPTNAPIIKVAS